MMKTYGVAMLHSTLYTLDATCYTTYATGYLRRTLHTTRPNSEFGLWESPNTLLLNKHISLSLSLGHQMSLRVVTRSRRGDSQIYRRHINYRRQIPVVKTTASIFIDLQSTYFAASNAQQTICIALDQYRLALTVTVCFEEIKNC